MTAESTKQRIRYWEAQSDALRKQGNTQGAEVAQRTADELRHTLKEKGK